MQEKPKIPKEKSLGGGVHYKQARTLRDSLNLRRERARLAKLTEKAIDSPALGRAIERMDRR